MTSPGTVVPAVLTSAVDITSPAVLQSWLSVVRAYNLCTAALAQGLAEHGVSPMEHEVYVNLARSPGISQQELVRRCFVAKSGMSMLLSKMEGAGALLRQADAADARVRCLFLTERGLAQAAKALAVQAEVMRVMAAPLETAEFGALQDIMERVSSALEMLMTRPVQ